MGALRVSVFDFDTLENLVLVVLADEFEISDEEFVALNTLRERIPKFGANPIREAIRGLERRGYLLRKKEMRLGGPFGIGPQEREIAVEAYRISREGMESVASFNGDYVANLWTELTAQADAVESARTIPKHDIWQPLQIDRSAPEFKEMAETSEKAIDRIEGDNGYATTAPEERASVVGSLRGSLTAIREGWASKGMLRMSLLAPLRFIFEKFAGTTIGEVAKRAFDAAVKWLQTL